VINVNDTTLGLVSAAVPLLIIGFLILRRLPWIFAFFVALLAVGLGYLETTGAVRDFGHKVRVALPEGVVASHHATETPATKPAEAPAMAPASPPAESTTTPASPPADQPAMAPASPSETPPASPPTAPESTPAPSTTPPADNNQTQPAPPQTPPATTP
jgi:hypothetical protein